GIDDVVLDRLTNPHYQASEGGQRSALTQTDEDLLELGYDEDQKNDQNTGGDEHDRDRIKHRRDHLALDFLGLFHEFGQARQDDFEHATQFAGFYHVDEQAIEYFRVLRQGLGKRAAAFDRKRQDADDGFKRGISFLLFEHAEPAQQRQAGID